MRRPRIHLVLALAAFSLAAWSAELVVTESSAPTFYRDFPRLTKQPQFVSRFLAMRCTLAPASAEDLEREKKATGPHHQARVHVYANPVALPTFSTPDEPFALGSVIIKEKLGRNDEATAVGGMIKRAPGYDPDNGDWEYFYYGKPGEFGTGRIAHCVECHRAARTTDYVYFTRRPSP